MQPRYVIPVIALALGAALFAAILRFGNLCQSPALARFVWFCTGGSSPQIQIEPPAACGRACSNDFLFNSECPAGLACTNGFCDALICGNGCGQVCSSDSDCDAGFNCLPQGSDPSAPKFCANDSCPVPLPEVLPHRQCGERCGEIADFCSGEEVCHVALRCATDLTCDMGIGGRVATEEGGICLGAPCELGCWSICRNDADCGSGLICEHSPSPFDLFGYCTGATCPANPPCINGDGICDPTCEQARLNANPETLIPFTALDGSIQACVDEYPCPSGTCRYTTGCFVARDNDCVTAATATLPPSAGGGSDVPTPTRAPFVSVPSPTAPPPDPCADHGGMQYSGSTCICPGIVDNVVICADGFKIDSPTTNQCTPAEQCTNPPGDGGGSSGGGQCQNSVCGDGKCDYPACENSVTCPADCFG